MRCDDRLAGVRRLLEDNGGGALLIRDVANVTYLSGFDDVWDEEPAALLLVTPDHALVFTDSRYAEAARRAATNTPWTVTIVDGDLWMSALAALPATCRRLGLESSLPHATFERVKAAFAGEVVGVEGWAEDLRAVKDADEIERISSAQRITELAFDHIMGWISVGMSEIEIALELEFFMRAHGSQGVAFPPIVASGPNSARPHAHPGVRVVERGDFLKMDFGACVAGYCADMTRTIVVGSASESQREIYELVLAANVAGIEAVRDGASGREVDRAARDVIVAGGFGDNFGHGLGHGVGLRVHEAPTLSARSESTLVAGNVVTVEPGIYVPGFGGVRIEDLVVVERTGASVLTRSAKGLIEL